MSGGETLLGTEQIEVRLEPLAHRLNMVQDMVDYAEEVARDLADHDNAEHFAHLRCGLLPYQAPAFLDTVNFLKNHTASLGPDSDLTVGGYLDCPTSFGKTVLMAKLLQAASIGGLVAPGSSRRRRALVLTPGAKDIKQIIGNDQRGLARHAPNITATGFYEEEKDLSGDIVVMTYYSFQLLLERIAKGQIEDPDFDLLLCDEAHHTLGEGVRRALTAYRQGKIALGMTATPEYDEERSVEQLLETCIHKSELLPLIKIGVLNGVQLIGLATNDRIKSTVKKGDYSETDLRSIRFSDERNAAIVATALQLIGEGRRGVINAVVGDDCSHAKYLAAALDGQEVVGLDGLPFTVRAEAIGQFTGANERRRILQEYAEGKIHVLTQVRGLDESWDEDEVSFIINAAPTTSRVRAFQRIGRGMRRSGDWPITVIVEFMDRYVGRNRSVTAWHVFEEDDFSQGKVFTTAEREAALARKADRKVGGGALRGARVRRPEPGGTGDDSRPLILDTVALPEELRKMSDEFVMRIGREFTIEKQPEYGPPKPGWLPLVQLLRLVRTDVGIYAFKTALKNEGGFEYELVKTAQGPIYYVEPGAKKFAEEYEPAEFAPSNKKAAADMQQAWADMGATREMIDAAIDRLVAAQVIKGEMLRSPKTRRTLRHFDPKERAHIKRDLKKKLDKLPDPTDTESVLLTDLAAEVNEKRNTVQFFLTRRHGITGSPVISPVRKKETTIYKKTEADIARFHFSHEPVPKEAIIEDYLPEQLGVSLKVLKSRADEPEIKQWLRRGRFADARNDYHYVLFCMPADLPALREALVRSLAETTSHEGPAPVVPANMLLYGDFLRQVRCTPSAGSYLIRQGTFAAALVVRDGVALIDVTSSRYLRNRCKQIDVAPKEYTSDIALAGRWKRSIEEVHEIVRSIMPRPTLVGLFRSVDNDWLTVHYARSLTLQIIHVLTQRYGKPE